MLLSYNEHTFYQILSLNSVHLCILEHCRFRGANLEKKNEVRSCSPLLGGFQTKQGTRHEVRLVSVCQPPLEGHKGSHIHNKSNSCSLGELHQEGDLKQLARSTIDCVPNSMASMKNDEFGSIFG